MENSKSGFLPMRHRIKLSKKQSPKTDEELKRMLDIPYALVIGSIQYAVQYTRPDVAYALSWRVDTGGYSDANFQSDDDWWCGYLKEFQVGYHSGFHHGS
ncbi:UNVERIFIED_CONTAM: hypothetical protein Scaly_3132600 [Sesamum calycinum]|uniref:Uncharacterized protein n=1 Tax=Sesamum calycinum TaxID=2727403 RepID=A0AAW2JI89_9LAMI